MNFITLVYNSIKNYIKEKDSCTYKKHSNFNFILDNILQYRNREINKVIIYSDTDSDYTLIEMEVN